MIRRSNAPRCWHCNTPLAPMHKPRVGYWFEEIQIEPGRTVKVHKGCVAGVLESVRKLTADFKVVDPYE